MIILRYMEEYYWSYYDIFVPKKSTLVILLFFLSASKRTLPYGRIDTLNSKIHPLVIILSKNREEQKYLALPYLNFHTKIKYFAARADKTLYNLVWYNTLHWNTLERERERERENCGGGGVISSLYRTLQQGRRRRSHLVPV